jgi:hypothetical protein
LRGFPEVALTFLATFSLRDRELGTLIEDSRASRVATALGRIVVMIAALVGCSQVSWSGQITCLSASCGLESQAHAGSSSLPPLSLQVTHFDLLSEAVTGQIVPIEWLGHLEWETKHVRDSLRRNSK